MKKKSNRTVVDGGEPALVVVTAKITRSQLTALQRRAHANCRTPSAEVRAMLIERLGNGAAPKTD